MEEGTALVLALQLVALAAIAAALLLYLLCRLRRRRPPIGLLGEGPGEGRAVLVTSADTALGLQLALRLAQRGFRVFAGLKEPEGSGAAARAVRAWRKAQEGMGGDEEATAATAALTALRLDVTREDLLHEAAGAVRSRLPAGQDGLWAVVNTAGCCARGRLEAQDSAVWEQLLRVNVVGALRSARALTPLLRSQKGRLLLLGSGCGGEGGAGIPVGGAAGGLVAFGAARAAVEGLAASLRPEAAAQGVSVVTLRPAPSLADSLFRPPRWRRQEVPECVPEGSEGAAELEALDFQVLPEQALRAIEEALLAARPKEAYVLPAPQQAAVCGGVWVLGGRDGQGCPLGRVFAACRRPRDKAATEGEVVAVTA